MSAAPIVAVAGIAFDDRDRVLLVRRGRPPGEGLWTVPGGKLQLGESLASGCAREVREETGLDVDVGPLVVVVERVVRGAGDRINYHYVIHDYLVTVRGGVLAPADDVTDAGWFAPKDLSYLELTDGLLPVLDNARQLR